MFAHRPPRREEEEGEREREKEVGGGVWGERERDGWKEEEGERGRVAQVRDIYNIIHI